MTRIEAANARKLEADAAFAAGDYAAAARDYTLAAEQFEQIWHEMHGHRGASPDAGTMRRAARQAILRRDNEAHRLTAEDQDDTPEDVVEVINASLLRRL